MDSNIESNIQNDPASDPPPDPSADQPNCLLTEFSKPAAKRFVNAKHAGLKLAVIVALGALVVLVLGAFAKANGIAITITPDLHLPVSDNTALTMTVAVTHVYGYLAELSHAFFFLVLAPLFVIISFCFFKSADGALQQLNDLKRLVALGTISSPTVFVGHRNKRFFRHLPVCLIIFLVGLGSYFELKSYTSVRRGNSFEVGYVQSQFLPQWINHFNTQTNEQEKWAMIKDFELNALLRDRIKAVLKESRTTATNWYRYITLNSSTDQHQSAIRDAMLSGDYTLQLNKAEAAGLITLSAAFEGGPRPNSKRENVAFYVFLTCLLIYEGCFHAFIAWVALKIIFWLMTIYDFMPNDKGGAFELQPLVADPVYRYGFCDLHAPYNQIVILLLVGAVAMSLNYVSNAAKGTSIYQGLGATVFLGQLLIQTAIFAVVVAIIVLPVWLFGNRLAVVKKSRLKELNHEIAIAHERRDQEREQKLEAERATVRLQTTWPWKDSGFRSLILAFAAFVVLPWFTMLHFIPEGPEEVRKRSQLDKTGDGRINCDSISLDSQLIGSLRKMK